MPGSHFIRVLHITIGDWDQRTDSIMPSNKSFEAVYARDYAQETAAQSEAISHAYWRPQNVLLGPLIAAYVTAGLVFVLFIDTGLASVLPNASPMLRFAMSLAVGGAMAYVVNGLWFDPAWNAIVKQGLARGRSPGDVRIRLDDRGVTWTTTDCKTRVAWTGIERFVLRENTLVLFSTPNVHYVPRDAFGTDNDLSAVLKDEVLPRLTTAVRDAALADPALRTLLDSTSAPPKGKHNARETSGRKAKAAAEDAFQWPSNKLAIEGGHPVAPVLQAPPTLEMSADLDELEGSTGIGELKRSAEWMDQPVQSGLEHARPDSSKSFAEADGDASVAPSPPAVFGKLGGSAGHSRHPTLKTPLSPRAATSIESVAGMPAPNIRSEHNAVHRLQPASTSGVDEFLADEPLLVQPPFMAAAGGKRHEKLVNSATTPADQNGTGVGDITRHSARQQAGEPHWPAWPGGVTRKAQPPAPLISEHTADPRLPSEPQDPEHPDPEFQDPWAETGSYQHEAETVGDGLTEEQSTLSDTGYASTPDGVGARSSDLGFWRLSKRKLKPRPRTPGDQAEHVAN